MIKVPKEIYTDILQKLICKVNKKSLSIDAKICSYLNSHE
jgi:hypothetical protein